MHKIFVMYRLKGGVTMEQYKTWSREIDQRITPGQPGMIRFEVYAIEGAEKGDPFVQVVEDIALGRGVVVPTQDQGNRRRTGGCIGWRAGRG